jgi:hypothetical protein
MMNPTLGRLIAEHADEVAAAVVQDLTSNPQTPSYHNRDGEELRERIGGVYRHLGNWLAENSDSLIAASDATVGGRRAFEDGTPLSELVYAVGLMKDHLSAFVRSQPTVYTPELYSVLKLYRELELLLVANQFFQKLLLQMVRSYEVVARGRRTDTPTPRG